MFNVQGHRGCSYLMPENTISSFLTAISIGANTIEMDVVITKDNQVLVSHDPWMCHTICLDNHGNKIENNKERYNIYNMTYDQIKLFDCGTLCNQKKSFIESIKETKPLLKDVFKEVEKYSNSIKYNIEIKSEIKYDNLFHPTPDIFSNLVYNEIKNSNIDLDRINIQSFDLRILQYFHKNYNHIKIGLLVEEDVSPSIMIQKLGFKPDIYSSNYIYLNEDQVNYLHNHNILVIPWTVNDDEDIKRMLSIGVNGMISDDPQKVICYLD